MTRYLIKNQKSFIILTVRHLHCSCRKKIVQIKGKINILKRKTSTHNNKLTQDMQVALVWIADETVVVYVMRHKCDPVVKLLVIEVCLKPN